MAIVPTPVVPIASNVIVPTPLHHPRTQYDPRTPYEVFRARFPEFVARFRDLRLHRTTSIAELAERPVARQRDLVRKMLRDRQLHRLYAYDAVRRVNMLREATPQSIDGLATRFNAFAPARDERALLRTIEKGSGRRVVHDFGPRRRMQQALVADILRQLHPPPRTQTLFNGGMPMARKAIATAYHDDGMRYGVEIDFVDFYGSISFEGLADLLRPLPTTVVEHVVWDFALRDDPRLCAVVGNTPYPTLNVPRGLSLGASTSPIVGERIVAHLLAVARQPGTITYADNLFVLGRTAQEVGERIHQIGESVASANLGTLRLREGLSYGYDLSRPFEFLKQEGRIRQASIQSEAGFDWAPSETKQNQYRVSASERRLELREIAAVERRVRHWRRAYPNWPDGDGREAEYLAELAVRRCYVDADPAHRNAAVHAIIVAHIATGSIRPLEDFVPTEGDPSGDARRALLTHLTRWVDNAQRGETPRHSIDLL